MKYKLIILIWVVLTFNIAAEEYEQKLGYLVFDSSNDFILQLGAPYHFLLKEYGPFDSDTQLVEYTSPRYSINKAESSDLIVTYSTYYERIDGIEIYSPHFETYFGVSVGSSSEFVIEKYGEPWLLEGSDSHPSFILYKIKIPSINHRAEFTYLRFDFIDAQVYVMNFYIGSGV